LFSNPKDEREVHFELKDRFHSFSYITRDLALGLESQMAWATVESKHWLYLSDCTWNKLLKLLLMLQAFSLIVFYLKTESFRLISCAKCILQAFGS
jgi:uncharacterized protein YybS (DUF2232 family)